MKSTRWKVLDSWVFAETEMPAAIAWIRDTKAQFKGGDALEVKSYRRDVRAASTRIGVIAVVARYKQAVVDLVVSTCTAGHDTRHEPFGTPAKCPARIEDLMNNEIHSCGAGWHSHKRIVEEVLDG